MIDIFAPSEERKAEKRAERIQKLNDLKAKLQEMKEENAAVRLNNLFFDTDKSDLLPYSIPELKRVAKIIKENNLRVEIAGHTDNVGDDNYNMSLSLRRAESVKSFLVSQGCPSDLFEIVGHGESKPQTTNDTAEGRALNRRVEMRFL